MRILVFDPPMCCSTGVCGPAVDTDLVRFAADLEQLKLRGITVERYGLAQNPGAFARHPVVAAQLSDHGLDCLPLVLVDDRMVAEGEYPSRRQLETLIEAERLRRTGGETHPN